MLLDLAVWAWTNENAGEKNLFYLLSYPNLTYQQYSQGSVCLSCFWLSSFILYARIKISGQKIVSMQNGATEDVMVAELLMKVKKFSDSLTSEII